MAESQETSDYPGALDNWVTLTNKEDLAEQSDINKIKAAIEAVQTEIGTDPAGTLATLKARLAIMMATNGALAQGTAFPTTPTPVEGQVFYRTDENTPYVYNGSDWIPFVGSSVQIFTSSGTFTASGGIDRVYLTMVGGGGGGGGSNVSNRGGGGGSGAVSIINLPYTVISGNNYTVTVGSGGAGGGNGSNGSNGQDSVFDSSITAYGGSLGTSSTGLGGVPTERMNGQSGAAASSDTGGGGTPGVKGGNGGDGQVGTPFRGGGGGASLFASGGGRSTTNGGAGSFGSGGAGADGDGGYSGGAGGDGFVLVSW
jgi:hypothetical protein